MASEECPNCKRLERRVAELESRVRKLMGEVEAAARAGKRQAAPFSKGKKAGKPKSPGRKPGKRYGQAAQRLAPSPDQIDEHYDAPLPAHCPGCGSEQFGEEVVHAQFQTEIPIKPIHRQFDVHVAQCLGCGGRVQGRHPLQTSDALGAAASHMGPNAIATMTHLNKEMGLSYGKIVTLMDEVFGITITRGGIAHAVARVGGALTGAYEQICNALPMQTMIVADETGWRVDGESAWLHGITNAQMTCYVIDPGRSAKPLIQLIGLDFDGVLIHDGWSPYDRFANAQHQQCLQHLLNRCERLIENARRGAVRFPRQVAQLLADALQIRDEYLAGTITDVMLPNRTAELESRLDGLLKPKRVNDENRKLANHLANHRNDLFTFLTNPSEIDATNWRGEHAMRAGVVNRKVWGGNRTWRGAQTQQVITSVIRTCRQQGIRVIDAIVDTLRGVTMSFNLT